MARLSPSAKIFRSIPAKFLPSTRQYNDICRYVIGDPSNRLDRVTRHTLRNRFEPLPAIERYGRNPVCRLVFDIASLHLGASGGGL